MYLCCLERGDQETTMVFKSASPLDDEVEVALIHPLQNLGGGYEAKEGLKTSKKSFIKRAQELFADHTCRCVFSCMVLLFVIIGVVLSAYFCPWCLLGILIISLCLVPSSPIWAIPMWLSLLLFIIFIIGLIKEDYSILFKNIKNK